MSKMCSSSLSSNEKHSFSKKLASAENTQNLDPKKLKRIMDSRKYSQKYRMKQLHYVLQLETEVKALQAEVAITSPRLKYVDRQNFLLRVENGSMKQRLSAFSNDLILKEAQYEELKKERDNLKHLYVAKRFHNYATTFNHFKEL